MSVAPGGTGGAVTRGGGCSRQDGRTQCVMLIIMSSDMS